MEPSNGHRRKLKNIVVDPKAQLRLFIPFGLLFIFSVAFLSLMYFQMGALVASLTESNDLGLIDKVLVVELHMLWIACTGIMILATITLVTWLLYSHRIFGPVVQIRRRLGELVDGKYDGLIKLRKYDEFKEIADDINRLAGRLAK